jgi:hypothetical protein
VRAHFPRFQPFHLLTEYHLKEIYQMKKISKKAYLIAAFLCTALIFSGCAAQNASSASTGSGDSGGGKIVITAEDVDGFSFSIDSRTLKGGMKVSDLAGAGYTLGQPAKSASVEAHKTQDALLIYKDRDVTLRATILNDTDAQAQAENCIIAGFVVDDTNLFTVSYGLSINHLKLGKSLSDFADLYVTPQDTADVITDSDTTTYVYHGSSGTGASLTLRFVSSAIDEMTYVYKAVS